MAMPEILFLVVGVIVLAKFSAVTIKNAVKFSKLSGINQLTVGFIIIAVATSLPELTIAVLSSLRGEGLLSMGNVIGANIANLTLIFGLIALFGFRLKRKDAIKSYEILLLTTVLAVFILLLMRTDIAFGIFSVIIFYVFSRAIFKSGLEVKNYKSQIKTVEMVKSLFYLLVSIAVVIISANVVTDSAIKLSQNLGIATSVIGATILAIGTTLPELSVGIAAIKKRNIELAVGDSIGSVMTNITLIIGIASIINPIAVGPVMVAGLLSLIFVNIIFMMLAARGLFRKPEGVFLLAVFVIYLFAMINIGMAQ